MDAAAVVVAAAAAGDLLLADDALLCCSLSVTGDGLGEPGWRSPAGPLFPTVEAAAAALTVSRLLEFLFLCRSIVVDDAGDDDVAVAAMMATRAREFTSFSSSSLLFCA